MSRPFKIEITESEEELKKRLQTANIASQKEKRYYAMVAKKWASQGTARNCKTLGERYFNGNKVVAKV